MPTPKTDWDRKYQQEMRKIDRRMLVLLEEREALLRGYEGHFDRPCKFKFEFDAQFEASRRARR